MRFALLLVIRLKFLYSFLKLIDMSFVVKHDFLDKVMTLAESIRKCVRKVYFVVGVLKCVFKSEHVVFLFGVPSLNWVPVLIDLLLLFCSISAKGLLTQL